MLENVDGMHLAIIGSTIVFAIVFTILKVLGARNQRFLDHEKRQAIMERYHREIARIRADKKLMEQRQREKEASNDS